ncbi:hypothetical protein C5E45_23805 [Nocardia nova]|uniref:Uncharacterized protein n=1 Tax=Nocardia nova TaxID=37330 RepID=A0A2S6AKT9_9NOCA|nr:hypothetical protein C5E45_23805 [Nocardia nova]
MLEPRFDLAAAPGVVGYSVRWRDRYSRTGPSIPDNALPPDLQLSELRFGWGDDPSAQIAAVAEWSQPRSHPPVARDTITMRPSWLWMRALTDAYNFQRSLLEYRPDEQQAWWWAAARVSGVISLWSQRTEIELGPLARAAEELSRFSYRSGSRCRPTRPRPASDLGHVALVLGHLQSEDHMVEGLLWGQLIAAARAIARAYGGRGEAQSAVDLERDVVRPLTWARLAMGAGTGRTDGAS